MAPPRLAPVETESDRRARDEEIARQIGRIAVDIDAVMLRAGDTRDRLEALGAEPNILLAANNAVRNLAEAAAAVRREGLLSLPQQRLL